MPLVYPLRRPLGTPPAVLWGWDGVRMGVRSPIMVGRPPDEAPKVKLKEVTISAEAHGYLVALARRGIYGRTVPAVVNFLIAHAVTDLVHKGMVDRIDGSPSAAIDEPA